MCTQFIKTVLDPSVTTLKAIFKNIHHFALATIAVFAILLFTIFSSSAIAMPANDNFSNSVAIAGTSGNVAGNNISATGEPGELSPGNNVTLNSAWYSWTPATTVNAHFEICTIRDYDTHLAVFTGAAVNALTTITFNDDFCLLGSGVNFLATAGTTYHIQVDGFSSNQGNFRLDYSSTPAGDMTPPTLSPVSISSNNANTTLAMPGDTITVAITSNEALAAAPTVTIAGQAAMVSGSGTSFSATLVVSGATPMGIAAINISSYADAAGNNGPAVTATTNGSSVTIDSAVPTVEILGAPTSLSDLTPFEVTIEFSEDVFGFVAGDVTVTNGTVTGFTPVDGNTYTVNITPSGAGDVTIEVLAGVADDAAGNDNTAATPVVITNTIVQVTQKVIATFMMNRANHILSNQPNLVSFVNGFNLNGGGPLGNLAVAGNLRSTTFAFSTSRSKILAAAAQNNQKQNFGASDDVLSRRHKSQFFGITKKEKPGKASKETKKVTIGESLEKQKSEFSGKNIASDRAGTWDVWTEIYGSRSNADTSKSTLWIGYVGAHMFVSQDMLVGVLGQLDWAKETDSTLGSKADGTGWMVGPYIAGRIPDQNVFYEVRASWGQSDNHVSPLGTYKDSFDTERWMVSAKVEGAYEMDKITLKPEASVSWFAEKQKRYTDSLSNTIPSQTISLGEIRFGPSIVFNEKLENGTLIQPSLGVLGVFNFGIRDNVASQGSVLGNRDIRTRLNAGLSVSDPMGIKFSASGFYDGIGIKDFYSYGGSVKLTVPLN